MREWNIFVDYLANIIIDRGSNIFINFNSMESTDRRGDGAGKTKNFVLYKNNYKLPQGHQNK